MLARYYNALRHDLQRPAGGWTTGIVTLLLAMMMPIVEIYGGRFISLLWACLFVFLHISWGAHGYYPRRI